MRTKISELVSNIAMDITFMTLGVAIGFVLKQLIH